MRTRTAYIFLLITMVCFTSSTAFSQSILQNDPDRSLEIQVNNAVEMWQEELALSSKQMDLMERKLVEFAIKKRKILQADISTRAKARRFTRLRVLENKDMRDILTKPQYERYLLLIDNPRDGYEDGI